MFDSEKPNECHNQVTNKFLAVVNKHTPLKKKTFRGNETPFMNKEIRKEIYTRSILKLKNEFFRCSTKENALPSKSKEINVLL